ncbi:hypothetical protein [Microlunatus antarcticus]|uniref:Uncharacterized protein n=1 Tax=Microlunatus antarcticus TaxID=53388 RepID=A0A7W5JX33_9ACTN|nr:hypothetical protein [Microlunatus antarcticus]MBB3327912.1 hypothetical protein [Microlunatus antarcticus]
MVDLEPTAADLADLVVRMTELAWPTTEDERLVLFDQLGLHDVESPRPDENVPGAERRWFASDLSSGLGGTATMFRGEFLGLGLFAYDEPVEDGERARVGYAAVRELVSRRLGPPVEEWGSAAEPACLWHPGPLMIDLYCFQRQRSGIMIGPDHADRSAAYEELASLTDGG